MPGKRPKVREKGRFMEVVKEDIRLVGVKEKEAQTA